MVNLDIDTLEVFNASMNEDKSILFKGEESDTAFQLNPDLTHSQTDRYYQIINPFDSNQVTTVYVFNLLYDALLFYGTKAPEVFRESLLVVVDETTKRTVADRLLGMFAKSDSPHHREGSFPKLHFNHHPEKADLFLFYLEMLNLTIYYNIIYISKALYLKIQYKSLSLTLSFRELKRLRYFLGVNDSKFKIKNNVLTKRSMNEIISW